MLPPRFRFAAIPNGCARTALLLTLVLLPCMCSCRAISRTLSDAEFHTSPALAKAIDLQEDLGAAFRLHHTEYFIVVTDVRSGTGEMAAQTLEAVRQDIYHHAPAIGLVPAPLADRLVCILFSERGDYQEYLRHVEGDETDWSSGHYSHEANIVVLHQERGNPAIAGVREAAQTQPTEFAIAAVAELATLHKTRHEAAHQILYNSGVLVRGRPYPPWIDEGLATLFETDPGAVNPFRLAIYRRMQAEGSLLPLQELLGAELTDFAPETLGRYYTQAWAFTYFLWNRHPERVVAYLAAIRSDSDPDVEKAFDRLVGEEHTVIELEFRQFVDGIDGG